MEGAQEIGYLVMPYRKEGSLEDWLNKQRKKGLSLEDAEHLIGQMAEAIQYMHNKDVLHRDIKPANFLIQSSSAYLNLPHLELADFGISKFNTGSPTKLRVTIAYTAPEQWDGKPPSKLNFIFSWLNFYPLIVK